MAADRTRGSVARLEDLLFGATGEAVDLLVHAGGVDHSRGEVVERAADLACTLADLGVAAGTPVGVMLPNGVDVVAALFGVWRAGGVYVPLNPRLGDDDLAQVLTTVDPAVIVAEAADAGRFGGRSLVVLRHGRSQLRPGGRAGERRYDPDVALVQFTSGTTGRPKPVLLLHSGVIQLLDGVIDKIRSSGTRRAGPPMPNLIPVSLSLWAGIYNVLFAMRVGAAVVVMDGFDTREFAALVRRFGIRSTVLPPAAMTMLADDPSLDDLEPLRFVRSITAPLSPLQARRFRDRFGIAVLNSYGQTELGGEIVGWNAADSRAHGDAKLGSVGRPHAGVQVRVVDAGGRDLPAGDSGELWVKAPAMSAGYADGSDLADRLSEDGWFRTGDIGRVDADGFVWIEGRLSDTINRGGLKVFPGEVEEVLRLAPGVSDAAVVSVPDERLGEVPVAFLVAGAGAPPSAGLEELCRQHLSPYKVPVAFHVVDALPTNEVGKVLRTELSRRATT
ncbi:MAG TPA: class I adenylate-forming enzyme family protein [Acidimicrobiales bacterium]